MIVHKMTKELEEVVGVTDHRTGGNRFGDRDTGLPSGIKLIEPSYNPQQTHYNPLTSFRQYDTKPEQSKPSRADLPEVGSLYLMHGAPTSNRASCVHGFWSGAGAGEGAALESKLPAAAMANLSRKEKRG